jgi:hypothetical protein
MLKLTTIRRQGTIAVLGRNLAVRVLIEKTARIELREAAVDEVDPSAGADGFLELHIQADGQNMEKVSSGGP